MKKQELARSRHKGARRAGAGPAARPATVGDIMTPDVTALDANRTLREAVDVFADLHIGGAPVVSAGRVVGVVTAADVLAFQASTPPVPAGRSDQMEAGEWGRPEEWEEGTEAPGAFFAEMWPDVAADAAERFAESRGPEWDILAEHTVAEVMTRRLCSIPMEAPVRDAASYMLRANVHRLLVMNAHACVGIVTTTDIVRGLASGKV